MFHQSALKVDHNLRNCGMNLSGRNYIMCRRIIAAAGTELSSVSCGQVKSKDMPFSDD